MNIEDYEQLETPSVAINMTAGALAGILEHCIMYPMDSVKVFIISSARVYFRCSSTTNTYNVTCI